MGVLTRTEEQLANYASNCAALATVNPSVLSDCQAMDDAWPAFFAKPEIEQKGVLASALPDRFNSTFWELSPWEAPEAPSIRAYFVLGTGLGIRIDRLLETGKPVILAEPRLLGLYEALLDFDWSDALSQGQLRLITEDYESTQDAILRLYPPLTSLSKIKGLEVVAGSPFWEHVLRDPLCSCDSDFGLGIAYYETFKLGNDKRFSTRLDDFDRHCLARGPIHQDRKLRILSYVAEGTVALETILRRYQAAFRALGHEFIIEYDEAPEVASRIGYMLSHKPDALIIPVWFGAHIFGNFDGLFDLPQITLANNAQLHLEAARTGARFEERRNHFCFAPDSAQLDYVMEHFGIASEILQLATTYESFPLPKEEEIAPVVRFIGSINDEDGHMAKLRHGPHWDELVERFWEFVDDNFMGDMDAFAGSVRHLTKLSDQDLIPLHLWSTIARVSGVEALAGLPIEIYGRENWRPILIGGPLEKAYKGHLDPIEELPRVMSRTLVNINFCVLGTTPAANMRTYDGTGLGTCVVQDRKPEAVANFEEDKEIIFFTNLAELRSKVEALLADPARAREIGKAARERVMREHTYQHRAQQILDTTYRRYDGWQPRIGNEWKQLFKEMN